MAGDIIRLHLQQNLFARSDDVKMLSAEKKLTTGNGLENPYVI
jgi:hypothetical protein